jgi:hypothetical protein
VCQSGLVGSLVTKSPDAYKKWLLFYARKIADEGLSAVARELCDDLVAPSRYLFEMIL